MGQSVLKRKKERSANFRSMHFARPRRTSTSSRTAPDIANELFRPSGKLQGKVPSAPIEAQVVGWPLLDRSNPLACPVGGRAKRAADLMIAVTAILILLPVMITTAAIIALTSGGNPIFSHKRVGYRGHFFPCYKFQTMVPDAQNALTKYLADNPVAAQEWEKRHKLRHDPRVTRLGLIMRKFSLDELPQLFNVLFGDMSCVGPRPVTFEELGHYGAKVGHYLSARPGITGLWQVNGRSDTDFPARVALDERYVQNWSLAGDISILAKTPAAVLRIMEAH